MSAEHDSRFSRIAAELTPTIWLGAIIGFLGAFWFMRWGYWVVPQSLEWVLDTIIRAPSLTVALIPQLITNRFLSYMEITLFTSVSWAIIGGVEVVIWRRVIDRLRRPDPRLNWIGRSWPVVQGLKSTAAIIGIVLASWILAGIICMPFGFCVFRPNLTSIASPGLGSLSSKVGIRFPAGTRLLYSDIHSFQGSYDFQAKLVVPHPALNRLMKSLPPARPPTEHELDDVQNLQEAHRWWNPSSLSELEIVKIPAKGFKGDSTLMDGEIYLSSGKSVVYLSGWGSSRD